MNIVFSSSIDKLKSVNSSFDAGVLRSCYHGKNKNKSEITKETFEKCINTIYNCPIVCNYSREDDEIGAHDVAIVKSDDGLKLINMTAPVGVVPAGAKHWWEEVEDDGVIHEYLCVDVLIWKRQEAYKKIKDNGITDQSMEITVKDGDLIDGIFKIYDFEFTAFCLLGSARPCFESASVSLFCVDQFRLSYSEMVKDLKKEFTINFDLKGGTNFLNENNKNTYLSTQSGVFALTEQFKEELLGSLNSVTYTAPWGDNIPKYSYIEYDAEKAEVYAYNREDWKLYGFTYTINGDSVAVDFDSVKRKKFSIIDFAEGDNDISFSRLFDDMRKYSEISKKISAMSGELDNLRKYKASKTLEERTNNETEIFSKFDDLSGVSAFVDLKNNAANLSISEIEEKCYSIRGRNISLNNLTFAAKQEKPPKLPIEKNKASDEPYGGIFVEYGMER